MTVALDHRTLRQSLCCRRSVHHADTVVTMWNASYTLNFKCLAAEHEKAFAEVLIKRDFALGAMISLAERLWPSD
jgi:hypothetical protein